MRSKRFFVVVALFLGAFISSHYAFDEFHTLMERGTEKERLEDTKYVINDCGRVVLVDRTEKYKKSSDSSPRIDYYVTYESKVEKGNITLDVTPGTYASGKRIKEQGGEICFLYADPQLTNHTLILNLSRTGFTILLVVFIVQSFIWAKEEFVMDEKEFRDKMLRNGYY